MLTSFQHSLKLKCDHGDMVGGFKVNKNYGDKFRSHCIKLEKRGRFLLFGVEFLQPRNARTVVTALIFVDELALA